MRRILQWDILQVKPLLSQAQAVLFFKTVNAALSVTASQQLMQKRVFVALPVLRQQNGAKTV